MSEGFYTDGKMSYYGYWHYFYENGNIYQIIKMVLGKL